MALMSADQGDGLDSNSAGNAENDESSYLKDKQGGEDNFDEDQELYALEEFVRYKFERSKRWREQDESRWLKAYKNYRGLYGPDVQFTEKEKSKIFVKITKTKVLAAYAQIVDVLFAGSKFPIGIDVPNLPLGAESSIYFDPNEDALKKEQKKNKIKIIPNTLNRADIQNRLGVVKKEVEEVSEESLREGVGSSPASAVFHPAQKTAELMEKNIHDQLEESNASTHLRNCVFDMSLFGTGVLKGPFAFDREYPKWDKTGKYSPEIKTIPKIESVSIWNFYPDPDSRSMEDAEYAIERHRMSKTQLRALKNRPFFRDEAIEIAIEKGVNYSQEHWESALEDNQSHYRINRYEVLEYWGVMDTELAVEANLTLPKEMKNKDQVQINTWICNGEILRLVLNPFTPNKIPYHAVPYEINPYSFFGVGLAENMDDTQEIMNGFMRMAVDNAALSSNLLIEIDETNLVPGQGLDIYPGKVFRRQAGAPGQAIFGTKFPNVTNECLMMFDKARQLTDEATGMPSYSHGMSGIQGVGRTASGMSMLMGAAAQNIKSIVRNVDDYLLNPLAKALFSFNMQFNFDKIYSKGVYEISAKGTESLMRNEVRSQRLLQFMQMTANPMMTPFVKYDYIIKEIAASMDLDEGKILNDPNAAKKQAVLMAELAALMPPPPQQQQQAQIPVPPVAGGEPPVPEESGFTGEGGGSAQAAEAAALATLQPQQPN
jgi:hypothetical protein